MVLPRNSRREGPSFGSLGGGRGSGRSGKILYHFVGRASTGKEIWFFSNSGAPLVRGAYMKAFRNKNSASLCFG